MKKIGFLSFGHWGKHPSYQTRSASDTLLQSIDLAVAAEEIGLDGAYFRVHHFAAQLGSPFPLLAAIGAKTRCLRAEILHHLRPHHSIRITREILNVGGGHKLAAWFRTFKYNGV